MILPKTTYQPRCALLGVDGPDAPPFATCSAAFILVPLVPVAPSSPRMDRRRASPAAAPRDGGGGAVSCCEMGIVGVVVDRRRLRERGGGVAEVRKSGVVAVEGASSRMDVEALVLRSSRILSAAVMCCDAFQTLVECVGCVTQC